MNIVTALKNSLIEEQNRWILWAPVGLGFGIFLYHAISFEPRLSISIAITAILLIVSCYLKYFLPLLLIALGFATANLRTVMLDTVMLEKPTKKLFASGVIEQVEYLSNRTRLIISQTIYNPTKPHLPKKVRLTTYKDMDFEPGQSLSFKANLFPLSHPSYPGGFDYRRYSYFQGIGAVGRLYDPVIEGISNNGWLNSLRHRLSEILRHSIKGQEGEIAAALITGDRSGITLSVRDQFANSGLAHILAISGLHLSLVAGIFFVLIRGGLALSPSIAERFNTKKIAAFWVIIASAIYMCIAGFGIPVQRAFCMILIVMLGVMLDRNPISLRLVAIAAFLILLIRPESLLSPSFQLSFAAVIALVALYESYWAKIHAWLQKPGKWRILSLYFGGVLTTTLVATLATTPFTIATFQKFTAVSIIGNIFAIPLTAFVIMPLCILGVLSFVWGGSPLLFVSLGKSIGALISIAKFTGSLPGATILTPLPHPAYIMIVTFGGLWLCLWRGKIRFLGVLPLVAAMFLIHAKPKPDILIAPRQTVIGVADHDVLYLSQPHRDQYITQQWQTCLGAKKIEIWDDFQDHPKIIETQAFMREHKQKRSPHCFAVFLNGDAEPIIGSRNRPWG